MRLGCHSINNSVYQVDVVFQDRNHGLNRFCYFYETESERQQERNFLQKDIKKLVEEKKLLSRSETRLAFALEFVIIIRVHQMNE